FNDAEERRLARDGAEVLVIVPLARAFTETGGHDVGVILVAANHQTVIRLAGAPVGEADRLSARPDERAFNRRIVQADPKTPRRGPAGEDKIVFGRVVDRHEMSAQRDRLVLGVRPIAGVEEVIVMSTEGSAVENADGSGGLDKANHEGGQGSEFSDRTKRLGLHKSGSF